MKSNCLHYNFHERTTPLMNCKRLITRFCAPSRRRTRQRNNPRGRISHTSPTSGRDAHSAISSHATIVRNSRAISFGRSFLNKSRNYHLFGGASARARDNQRDDRVRSSSKFPSDSACYLVLTHVHSSNESVMLFCTYLEG